jgi:hypothetical protein
MAVHALRKYIGGAWTALSSAQEQVLDLGVIRGNAGVDVGSLASGVPITGGNQMVRITNGEAGALSFAVCVASNTGKIYCKTAANFAEGDTITIANGTHAPDIYEFDVGVKATGTVTIEAANANTGDTITIDDGVNPAVTFEFDSGVQGSDGQITIAAVTDGQTLTAYSHTFEFDGGVFATGTIEFICQPADGQTLTLDDGTNDPTVFEFDDDASVGVGNVAVTIGADFAATATALHTAINAVGAGLTVTSADDTAGTLTITNDVVGNAAAQNTPIVTTSHAVILTGMAGGLEPGSGPVTAGNVAVAIGASATDSAHNLLAAMATHVVHLAANSTHALGVISLVWDANDSSYNTTMTKVGAGITIDHQPTNGATPGADVTPGNVGVALGATNLLSGTLLLAQIQQQKVLGNLDITAVAGGTANIINLTNDAYGVAGNVAITDTGGARISETGMTGGVDAGGSVQAGHKAVVRGATPAISLANFATTLTTNVATSHVVPGTVYTDTIDGYACTVLPYTGVAATDFIAVVPATDVIAAGNVNAKIGTEEYIQNQIGVVEVSATTGYPTANTLAQTDLVMSVAGGDYGYFAIAKGMEGTGVTQGNITAKVIVVPILATATTTHGAFTATTDYLDVSGVVKNR